jgi:hypothetical protein
LEQVADRRGRKVDCRCNEPSLGAAATLTGALARLGEAEPARALGEDTLQRSRRVLGPDHPITLYLAQVAGIGHLVLGDDAVGDRHSRPL